MESGFEYRVATLDDIEELVHYWCESTNYHEGIEPRFKYASDADEWTKKISFDGYAVNDKLFEGGKRISFLREGRRGLPVWQSNSRMKVSWGEDKIVQRTSERSRYQTRGFDTPHRPMDDAFVIVGSGTGINRKGLAYKRTIEKPLPCLAFSWIPRLTSSDCVTN